MTEEHPEPQLPELNAADVRILGCLVEKQASNPETYPLTLNALVLACNQKTSRDPLMQLSPGEVGQRLRSLEGAGLTRLVMGNRADRWEHRLDKALELVPAQVALIGLLFLRGAQTIGDLLTRSSRLHAFDDAEQVRHQLERLIARGYAHQLPRQAGQREVRYTHGWADLAQIPAANGPAESIESAADSRIEALEARVAALEARLAGLGLD
ncbi:DUF480 domain-containing protein [Pseudomonas sp. RIT-PI-S]|uniref:YceH family protein n=1 Tax=Pseudomonas sp. RIT-PI-S TaxID=3035295 RepID=UPI0021DB5238|nr:DUF480 domain-containing protein [Pseudomonas sp. RIT-PI-S]